MTALEAKKLLKGTKYEHLPESDLGELVKTIRSFMEVVADRVIEYQVKTGLDAKTSSHSS